MELYVPFLSLHSHNTAPTLGWEFHYQFIATMQGKQLLSGIKKWVWKFKYVWTLLIFALIIGVLDTNSLWRRYQIRQENKALREEIQSLKKQFEINKKEPDGLQNDPDVVEEVARMHLFMRKADEDVYVIE